MAHPYTLVALIHCKWKFIPVPFQHNPLLRDNAIAWKEVRKWLKLSPFMSRHLTIQGNPHFPPEMDHKPFHIWEQKGLTKFSTVCIMETGHPHNFSTIAETFSLPKTHAFHFGQCVNFIRNSCSFVVYCNILGFSLLKVCSLAMGWYIFSVLICYSNLLTQLDVILK